MFMVKHSEGEVIINQGDEGDNFYIIDNGDVEVCFRFVITMCVLNLFGLFPVGKNCQKNILIKNA